MTWKRRAVGSPSLSDRANMMVPDAGAMLGADDGEAAVVATPPGMLTATLPATSAAATRMGARLMNVFLPLFCSFVCRHGV